MGFRLQVPYITQLNIGGHVPGNTAAWDDPTGCWYASVCMIGYFFEQGPRHGLPELFNRPHPTHMQHQAISQDRHDRLLLKREGLEVVPGSDRRQDYTSIRIQRLLATSGPILFYWWKTSGGNRYGHASVMVGTEPSAIVYHDPESRNNGGENRQMPIAQFNANRMFNPGVYGLLQRANLRDVDVLTIRRRTLGRSVSQIRQRFGG